MTQMIKFFKNMFFKKEVSKNSSEVDLELKVAMLRVRIENFRKKYNYPVQTYNISDVIKKQDNTDAALNRSAEMDEVKRKLMGFKKQ